MTETYDEKWCRPKPCKVCYTKTVSGFLFYPIQTMFNIINGNTPPHLETNDGGGGWCNTERCDGTHLSTTKHRSMIKSTNKGFTLVELLIVIAIIGILAGVVIVQLQGSTGTASSAVVERNLQSVAGLSTQRVLDASKNNIHSVKNWVFCDTGSVDVDTEGIVGSTSTQMKSVLDGLFASIETSPSTRVSTLAGAEFIKKIPAANAKVYTTGPDFDFTASTTTPSTNLPLGGCLSVKDGTKPGNWVVWAQTKDDDGNDVIICRDSQGASTSDPWSNGDKHSIIDAEDVNCGDLF